MSEMQRVFTPEIGERLSGTPLLVMLDVDGTLAPIAPRPEDATVAPATREVLKRLIASKGVTVILVSGRAASDAQQIVGVDGVYTVGNHGFEVVTPEGELETDPDLADQSAAITQAARELEPIVAAVEGARLENKRWTLSVHYRLAARDAVPPLRDEVERVALGLRLRMTDGKEIVEVRPVAHVDKGTAVVMLGERLLGFGDGASIVFIGDDRTDEDAFRSLRARSARAVTIRVDETGENETAAEVVLRNPAAVHDFLELLAVRRA
jgi:trehalose-phosphatase